MEKQHPVHDMKIIPRIYKISYRNVSRKFFQGILAGGFIRPVMMLLAILCASRGVPAAQPELNSDERTMRLASISYPVSESGQYRLHIYFRAPYQSFYFVKPDSVYKSKYQISFNINDSRSQFFKTEVINGDIEVADFNATKSAESHIRHHVQFLVPPDHYVVEVQIEDLESSRSVSEQYNIEVPDSRDNPVVLSDPLFVKSTFEEGDIPDFYPPDDIIVADYADSVYAYSFVYRDDPATDAVLDWRAKTLGNHETFAASGRIRLTAPDRLVRVPIAFTGNDIPSGEYRLEVSCTSGAQTTEHSWEFSIIWRNRPITAYDINAVARQMEYILPQNQYDVLQNKEGEDKRDYFLSLWKEKDPTEDTEKNELMEEYYYRVEYANLAFATSQTEGWKSDRGRIFILLGAPDRIKRRYRDFDTPPYEIWEYAALGRSYYFADKENTGEFKLVSIRE